MEEGQKEGKNKKIKKNLIFNPIFDPLFLFLFVNFYLKSIKKVIARLPTCLEEPSYKVRTCRNPKHFHIIKKKIQTVKLLLFLEKILGISSFEKWGLLVDFFFFFVKILFIFSLFHVLFGSFCLFTNKLFTCYPSFGSFANTPSLGSFFEPIYNSTL